jgi:hypothetical protein
MKRLISVTIFYLTATLCIGQPSYPTQDSVHIFWQPDVKLTSKDYQGQPTSNIEELMKKYDFSASASVGIWSILDIPQRKKDRDRKFEKVYFAPAFEKTTSFTKSDDSLQIEMQNLYFDICEVWARWARKKLKSLQDSSKSIGTLSIFYMTVKQTMNDNRLMMYRMYFKDVFIDKKDGAFAKWRQEIDKELANTKQWETTPEECYRLISQKPTEDGYIQAPKVVGVLENDTKTYRQL